MRTKPDCRTILSIIALVALFGVVAPAGAEAPTAGQPRVEFTSLTHDFGQAPSGEDLKTTFTFKNVGDSVLVIENVKGG